MRDLPWVAQVVNRRHRDAARSAHRAAKRHATATEESSQRKFVAARRHPRGGGSRQPTSPKASEGQSVLAIGWRFPLLLLRACSSAAGGNRPFCPGDGGLSKCRWARDLRASRRSGFPARPERAGKPVLRQGGCGSTSQREWNQPPDVSDSRPWLRSLRSLTYSLPPQCSRPDTTPVHRGLPF